MAVLIAPVEAEPAPPALPTLRGDERIAYTASAGVVVIRRRRAA